MKIYNSLTRTKDEFIPINEGRIGMYVCGPTVYDEPHIGHARSAYIFDVIRRYLAHRGYRVTFVRNVTDVDDKIINKAKEAAGLQPFPPSLRLAGPRQGQRPTGGATVSLEEATRQISKRYLDAYHEDMSSLGIREPDREPKATEYIPKMITFIRKLIENGCAYAVESDVYFDIKKAGSYGKLSNQNLEKMEIGARISPGEKKRDHLDFALWKGAKEGEPSWDSPWGRGRPGWHIECSVMSSDILGDEFDIHGGGIDLIFPHHENEIAQSEGASKKFARFWIHNGLLTIAGEKMAKSLGNFISIKKFIAGHKDPDYLKLLFLNTHYRHPVDYTEAKIAEMKAQKERFLIFVEKTDRLIQRSASGVQRDSMELEEFKKMFEEAMDDDFNTPLALAALFDMVTHINRIIQTKTSFTDEEAAVIALSRDLLVRLGSVLGLNLAKGVANQDIGDEEVGDMIAKRNKARTDKDFKRADQIRKTLDGKGIILEDTKDGTTWRRKM